MKQEELDRFLRDCYLELRYITVHKVGSCGIEFVEIEDAPRDIINIEEIIFYLSYKNEELNNTILDFSVQKWVKSKRESGIEVITFNNKTANERKDAAFFYSLFVE